MGGVKFEERGRFLGRYFEVAFYHFIDLCMNS